MQFRCVFFLGKIFEVADALKDFLAFARSLGHNVKEIISDKKEEFNNKWIWIILKKNVIIQRLSAPYTPEQTGGSQREIG